MSPYVCDCTNVVYMFCVYCIYYYVNKFEARSSFSTSHLHVEFEQINARSIANFKNSISNAVIISKLDIGPSANPNVNYNILSDIITTAKANHIPKRKKKNNTRKFKKQP